MVGKSCLPFIQAVFYFPASIHTRDSTLNHTRQKTLRVIKKLHPGLTPVKKSRVSCAINSNRHQSYKKTINRILQILFLILLTLSIIFEIVFFCSKFVQFFFIFSIHLLYFFLHALMSELVPFWTIPLDLCTRNLGKGGHKK